MSLFRIFDNLKLNLQYLGLRIYVIRLYLYFIFISQVPIFNFHRTWLVFQIFFNFRHKGVFGTGKTPNFRAQRHCDKCFTSYKRISKHKALLEKHQTGVQTGIRVETVSIKIRYDVLLGSDLDLNCLQRLSADDTSRHSYFLLSAGSTHPNITENC